MFPSKIEWEVELANARFRRALEDSRDLLGNIKFHYKMVDCVNSRHLCPLPCVFLSLLF